MFQYWVASLSVHMGMQFHIPVPKVLVLACEVLESELLSFIQELAEGRITVSLVFMHHSDSLKSS